jgi:hypothetical protein
MFNMTYIGFGVSKPRNTLETTISNANPSGCAQKNLRISQRISFADLTANAGSGGTRPICTMPEKKNVVAARRK